jgi:O-antigen/teichoic acid export membrane protein
MSQGIRRLASSTGTDIITTYGTQLIMMVLGTLSSVVMARTLGPEGKGAVQVAQLLASEGAQIASFGVGVSVIYTMSKKQFLNPQVAGSAIYIAMGIGIPLVAALIILAVVLGPFFLSDQEDGPLYIVIGAPAAFFLLLQSMFLGLYRGANNFGKYNILSLSSKVIYLVTVSVVLVGVASHARSALWAGCIAHGAFGLLLFCLTWKDFGFSFNNLGPVLKQLLSFNFLGHIGSILQTISYRLDIFVVAFFCSTIEVGLYGMAVSIGQIMWHLPNAIGMILLSKTPADNRQSADVRLIFICQSLLLIMGLVVAMGAILAPMIFPLVFGEGFRGSSRPFLFLLPGILSLSLWKVIANDMSGRGRTVYKLYSSAAGAVATVLLDFTLIPRYGIEGAAVASSIAYSVSTVVILYLATRETQIPLRNLLLPEQYTFRRILKRTRTIMAPMEEQLRAK